MRMRSLRTLLMLLCVVGLGLGCRSEGESGPTPSSSPVAPAPTVTVTATPSPQADASDSQPMRLRAKAEFTEASKVTFEIRIAGQVVGSYNANAESELSSYLKDGENVVTVTWTADPSMTEDSSAKFFLEEMRPGQSDWNSVISRQIGATTVAGSAEMTVMAGTPGTDPTAVGQKTVDINESPTPALSPTAISQAATASLKNSYTAKVDNNSLMPTTFTLTLNGRPAGTYAGDADQDISDLIVKGSNKGSLTYKVQQTEGNLHISAQSKFVLGKKMDGDKWSTVFSQDVSRKNQEGTREFEFEAE